MNKRKRIAQALKSTVNAWLASLPSSLAKEASHSYIVSGGAILSLLEGTDPNDFDIYFDNAETAGKLAEHYMLQLCRKRASDIQILDTRVIVPAVAETTRKTILSYTDNYKPICSTHNAITLSKGVQLVMRFCGTPEEIHKNFDFAHTTNYYTKKDGLVLSPEALESTVLRELRYVGSRYPICSLIRLSKFIRRGWTIPPQELVKISYDVSRLDVTDPKVLAEQLAGAYHGRFGKVIDTLADYVGEISRDSLFNIIDSLGETSEE